MLGWKLRASPGAEQRQKPLLLPPHCGDSVPVPTYCACGFIRHRAKAGHPLLGLLQQGERNACLLHNVFFSALGTFFPAREPRAPWQAKAGS